MFGKYTKLKKKSLVAVCKRCGVYFSSFYDGENLEDVDLFFRKSLSCIYFPVGYSSDMINYFNREDRPCMTKDDWMVYKFLK